MGRKTLHVSEEVWYEVMRLRLEWRCRSVDEVIRMLLRKGGNDREG